MPATIERHMAAAIAVAPDAPSRIELIPIGEFKTADRRGTFRLDDAAAVIRASLEEAPGGHLCIDFGHGIHGAAERRSSAAGWITGLEAEGNRIVASVEWTPEGEAALKGRSYRFVSPVFRTSGRRVVAIEGAGLVNNPALPQLRQLASQQEESSMEDLQKIAAALGLGEDASIEDSIAAIEKVRSDAERNATVLASVMEAAKVTDLSDGSVRQLCSRVASEPDPTLYVPRVAMEEVTLQLASLQRQVNETAVEAAVGAAMKAGKLSPAMEAWGRQLAAKDMTSFQAFVAGAPVLVAGDRQVSGDPPAGEGGLTETERQICAATGVDPARFLATKKEHA